MIKMYERNHKRMNSKLCIVGTERLCIVGTERLCIVGTEQLCIVGTEQLSWRLLRNDSDVFKGPKKKYIFNSPVNYEITRKCYLMLIRNLLSQIKYNIKLKYNWMWQTTEECWLQLRAHGWTMTALQSSEGTWLDDDGSAVLWGHMAGRWRPCSPLGVHGWTMTALQSSGGTWLNDDGPAVLWGHMTGRWRPCSPLEAHGWTMTALQSSEGTWLDDDGPAVVWGATDIKEAE
jgi:hypothetical protein